MDIVEVKDQYKLAIAGNANAMLAFVANMNKDGCLHLDSFVNLLFKVKLAEKDNTQAYAELLAPIDVDLTSSTVSIPLVYLEREVEKKMKEELAESSKQVIKDSEAYKARMIAKEEAERKAEEAKRKAEEDAKRKAEKEAKRKAEETKRKAEEDKKRKAEETKRKAEEDKKRKAEETKRKAEEDKKRKAEETKRKAEEDKKRKAEESKRKAEEDKKRKAEESKRKAEEDVKEKEEQERKEKEEKTKKAWHSVVDSFLKKEKTYEYTTGFFKKKTVRVRYIDSPVTERLYNAIMLMDNLTEWEKRNDKATSNVIIAESFDDFIYKLNKYISGRKKYGCLSEIEGVRKYLIEHHVISNYGEYLYIVT